MLLTDLSKKIKHYHMQGSIDGITIESIEMNSREVENGALFVCLEGFTVDGHEFVEDAINNGAVAIVSQKPISASVPVIQVADTIKALAILADAFYDSPSNELNIIGVTGTNGKTTLTYLLDEIYTKAGKKTAVIGTIEMKIGDDTYPVANTTPDALFLHKNLRKMVNQNVDTVIMEVSSHALSLGRVYGVDFNRVCFTNLSQDHLDYHKDMDEYAYAKSLLFAQLGNKFSDEKSAIVNADSPYSRMMERATSHPVISYGIDSNALVSATNIHLSPRGLVFDINTSNGNFSVETNLTGKFNVYNMLAAVGVAVSDNVSTSTIQEALEAVKGVPGRFEAVKSEAPYTVIVDYAHTPDSLENVLLSIEELKENRVITIVGCGGDRDRSKRPKMANIAMEYSDYVVFTSDNPRSEEPATILEDMTDGLTQTHYEVIENRKDAINAVIGEADEGDIILIAGKGHETYQEINGIKHHFDDRETALEAINSNLKE
ncbi:UDP-N-acetylmuramoyl-L-alanyl-D-glutamate--2,6-diaminopimelate ligase [Halalkalibacillus halophilus]|uniref:UDP-N-acetylmuramoyl-L-alanyl-D-glutamate--2, 6-diaminopimelate ligase n=1 Tax=Halalkalibacillus halophilus TaxID=392827 RepID=UPI0003FB6F70|nr:UDP-N-acetylmuramoyl-L-alanyl-D-glutamate--2,6-diaminopimelate ligase [Halalkalibacillus halophilus]